VDLTNSVDGQINAQRVMKLVEQTNEFIFLQQHWHSNTRCEREKFPEIISAVFSAIG